MDFEDWLSERYVVHHVSRGTQLKLSGGACPFCGEERDDLRLYISAATGRGQCFHCSTGFDAIKFVMAFEKCSYTKAKAILAGDGDGFVGKRIEPEAPPSLVWPEHAPIAESALAVEYLSGRGIGPDLIEHFGLYFCPSNTAIGDRLYYTRDRVVIPLFDRCGNPVSWQARDCTGLAKTRYIFPPGFSGADYLFNAHAIPGGADYLILCEGVFDVFGWWRAGFKNAVATFGKKISEGQLAALRAIAPGCLFVAWDSDAAVQRVEFCERYGHHFKMLKIIDLGGQDADELGAGRLASALVDASPPRWEDKILAAL